MLFCSRLRCIAVLLCSLALGAGPVNSGESKIVLPDIGDPSGAVITPVQEKELGDAFFRDLHNHLRINQDPQISDFIQSLGNRLAANSDNPQQSFSFFVVIDPTINAFAGPAGYIGINSGLILNSESESELASVMAHEIAHVTQRHLHRAFEAAGKLSIPVAAATLAAILIGTQSAELGQAALIAAQAGSLQYQIDFTRDNEEEADRIGIQTLTRADLDPRAMPAFFERLQQSTRYYGQGPPEFLRTHPVTVSRIADTRSRAEKYPYQQYSDSITYQLAKAKLRVFSAKSFETSRDYFSSVQDQGTKTQRAVSSYGLAISLLAGGQPGKARTILANLVKQYPEQPEYLSALANAEFTAKNREKALSLYQQAMVRFPENYALNIDYAEILLSAGKPAEARKLLEKHAQPEASRSAQIYRLLATAYGDEKKTVEAHRYLAEYYFITGRIESAIIQAKIALKNADGDYYLTAVLQERLNRYLSIKNELAQR